MQPPRDRFSSEQVNSIRALVTAIVAATIVAGAIRATPVLVDILAPVLASLLKRLGFSRVGQITHDVIDGALVIALRRFNARVRAIDQLPDKTWCQIWSLLSLRDREAVTKVCRAWRTLAIETPEIWQSIQFITDRHGRLCRCRGCIGGMSDSRHSNIATLRLAFQRGRETDIDLVIDACTKAVMTTDNLDLLDRKSFQALTIILLDNLSRIVRITLMTDQLEYYGAIMQWWKNMAFSRLHTIRLIHLAKPWFEEVQLKPVSGYISFRAPLLRQYEALSGVFEWPVHTMQSQTRHLTDLSIGVNIHWIDVPSILKQCPLLKRARLYASRVELVGIRSSQFVAPDVYPSLRHLIVEDVPAFLEPQAVSSEDEKLYDLVWDAFLFPPTEVFRINYADSDGLTTPRRGLALFRSLRSEPKIILAMSNPRPGLVCFSAKPLTSALDCLATDGALVGATRIVTCPMHGPQTATRVLKDLGAHLNLEVVHTLWVQIGAYNEWLFPCIAAHMPHLPAATTVDVLAERLLSAEPLITIATEAGWDERLPVLTRLALHISATSSNFNNWTSAEGSS